MSQTVTQKPASAVVEETGSIGVPILFAVTLFVSALLLFLVQPMIAKMILPFLGGSPAVWNTCQVFFQAVLLVGYTYAHVSTGWLGVRNQGWMHLLLMFAPLAVLPLSLRNWEPPGGDNPVGWLWWLFLLLSVSVGLPFFILSTTAPLMQRWFTETGHPSARDPYFLYAASNFGSMLALLGYPTLVEPYIPVRGSENVWANQINLWAVGYGVLLVLLAACRIVVALSKPPDWKLSREIFEISHKDMVEKKPVQASPYTTTVSFGTRLRWVALAFVPSSLMLGVTTYLTLDIAAIPLLWVIPLSIYLLSFILVFARWPLFLHQTVLAVTPLLILLIIFMLESGTNPSVKWTIMLYLAALFLVAMTCHGELARTKPEASRLTEFYLLMSLGGVLGGLFNGLAAPLVFNDVIEHKVAMIMACFLIPSLTGDSSLFMERLFSLKPSKTRGVIVDLAFGLLLGCFAFGLLQFNSWARGVEDKHPHIYSAWKAMHSGSFEASDALRSSVAWIQEHILHRPGQVSAFNIRPNRILMIFLYGIPVLICYAFATRPLRFGTAVAAFVAASMLFDYGQATNVLHQDRSFFGVLKVVDEEDEPFPAHALYHGTTLHGMQYTPLDMQDEPITYYYRSGPVGQTFRAARTIAPTKRIAVIGLGSGTTACYGQKGDTLTYYEIDNLVKKIATNPEYFTFLERCEKRGCPIDIKMGDARLELRKAPDHCYDMIIVDAFSSDAIPVHLLTKQAVEMYFDKLAPHGYLMIHISNRYLKLAPVVARIAEALHVAAVKQYDDATLGYAGKTASDWIVLTPDEKDLQPLLAGQPSLAEWSKSPPFVGVWPVLGFLVPSEKVHEFIDDEKPLWRPLKTEEKVGLWTDDYSNLLQVFSW
jgi:hypothetical protein